MNYKHELKPCPFCGAKPLLSSSFGKLSASCVNRRCTVQPSTWLRVRDTTDLRVVAGAWNMRRADPEPPSDVAYGATVQAATEQEGWPNSTQREAGSTTQPRQEEPA